MEKRQRLSYIYLKSLVTLKVDFNYHWYGIDLWNWCKYKCVSKPVTDIITVNYECNWSTGSMATANTAGGSLFNWELSYVTQWITFAFFQLHVAPRHGRSCGYGGGDEEETDGIETSEKAMDTLATCREGPSRSYTALPVFPAAASRFLIGHFLNV